MNFSLDFLYSFWVITAFHLISTYFTTYHIASYCIASPLYSRIALHYIWPHLASYRIDTTTPFTHSHSIRTNQYHHSKTNKKAWIRRVDIDLQDLHYGPSRTWPTFRWSTLPPRPGDRKDETLHTGARSCTSKKRDGGQPSTLYAWAGYRPTSESEFRAFMAGQAPAAARTGVMSDLGEGDVRPLCSALLRRSQDGKRLRLLGRNTSRCFLLREYGPASFSVIRSCFEACSRHRTRQLRPRRLSSTSQLALRPPTRDPRGESRTGKKNLSITSIIINPGLCVHISFLF